MELNIEGIHHFLGDFNARLVRLVHPLRMTRQTSLGCGVVEIVQDQV